MPRSAKCLLTPSDFPRQYPLTIDTIHDEAYDIYDHDILSLHFEPTDMQISSPSTRRETAGSQGGLNLAPVTGITCGPATLTVVDLSQESVPVPDGTFPARQVDRLRKFPDRLRSEVLLSSFCEDVGGVEGSSPSPLVHNIAPDLEYPQPPHQRLVHRPSSELGEVIYVTAQCCSSVSSQLFCAGLGFGDDRQRWELYVIAPVNRQLQKRKNFWEKDEGSSREFRRTQGCWADRGQGVRR